MSLKSVTEYSNARNNAWFFRILFIIISFSAFIPSQREFVFFIFLLFVCGWISCWIFSKRYEDTKAVLAFSLLAISVCLVVVCYAGSIQTGMDEYPGLSFFSLMFRMWVSKIQTEVSSYISFSLNMVLLLGILAFVFNVLASILFIIRKDKKYKKRLSILFIFFLPLLYQHLFTAGLFEYEKESFLYRVFLSSPLLFMASFFKSHQNKAYNV